MGKDEYDSVLNKWNFLQNNKETWHTAVTIPYTKLLSPKLAKGTLTRSTIIREIYQAVTHKRLTLIAAPAGAGKTTAVVTLHDTHPDLPLAWAALDEGDDAPHAFLQLFIAAVQREAAGYGRQVQQILGAGGENTPDWPRLMGALINDLDAHTDEPLIIAPDDLHRISNKTIHNLLDYLLERMPPHIHLVITTRHDPPLRLALLRARGQMAEVLLEDLRFSVADITSLFNDVLGLGLPPADLQLVHERTEGWAAGVRLLTLTLPRLASTDKRANLIQHLAASQRFLFDYLIEEVLNQLDAADRDFLLQTAVLDEMTLTLSNAVTGRTDAAATLDALYRQNLFLVVNETADPLAEPTYSTHALFAQFLQNQLRQQVEMKVTDLHLRAAHAVTSPERRIYHLMAAKSWGEAAKAIIAIGKKQCDREFVRPQVIAWIGRLPADIRQRYYWLDQIKASYLRQRGHLSEAWQLCKAALPVVQASGDLSGDLEALWILSFLYTEQPEPEWAAALQDSFPNSPTFSHQPVMHFT